MHGKSMSIVGRYSPGGKKPRRKRSQSAADDLFSTDIAVPDLSNPTELYAFGLRTMVLLAGASPDLHIRRDAAAFLCREFESSKPGSKDFHSERAAVVAELRQAITRLVPAPAATAGTEADELEAETETADGIEMEVEITGNAPPVPAKT
jgi:hypothetical protein